MRIAMTAPFVCGMLAVLTACGAGEGWDGPLPSSGTAYKALGDADRLGVAASCRDAAAGRADGLAARQLADTDPAALRAELDAVYRVITEQRRPVGEVCARALPFVTSGLELQFAQAQGGGSDFVYRTTSDKRLTIRGRVLPPPATGRVTAVRAVRPTRTHVAAIGPDGRFSFRGLRLRRVADNSFILTIAAPPNAPRKVIFSAICTDCLAGASPSALPN